MDIARIFTVTDEDSSKRLDQYLASIVLGAAGIPALTRSGVKNLIDKGKVLVNGKSVKAGHALKTGELVSVELPGEKPAEAAPEAIPLSIIYEDDDIIVVDKQAGLCVHPGAGRESGTLVNALLNHTKNLSNIDPQRPGIVHRLDMDTTGVLVVAKNNAAHENLARQFKEHTTRRRYQALVRGAMREDEGVIDLPIGRAAEQRKKMSTRARRSRKAVTNWRVLRRYPGLTLVELMPETGRTHQLRVHLSAMHRPVVGDQVYGGKGLNPFKGLSSNLPGPIVDKLKGVKRQFLHAGTLGIKHPVTGEYMEFTSPLPADMGGIIKLLDNACSESGKKTA